MNKAVVWVSFNVNNPDNAYWPNYIMNLLDTPYGELVEIIRLVEYNDGPTDVVTCEQNTCEVHIQPSWLRETLR